MIECYEIEYYVSLTFHHTKKKKKDMKNFEAPVRPPLNPPLSPRVTQELWIGPFDYSDNVE